MKKIIFSLCIILFAHGAFAETKLDLGLEVYNNKAQCGVCHTLQAAGSSGNIGPNLDQLKPSIDRIIYVVTNGSGVMQAWEGILTDEEIEAVAHYIFNSTNK
jgi:mono/diheme cytochrome c family protein|tara:strand:- start:1287 stop:1592 length:306 start_codon:yes stop_codon:yes gene_type:complete